MKNILKTHLFMFGILLFLFTSSIPICAKTYEAPLEGGIVYVYYTKATESVIGSTNRSGAYLFSYRDGGTYTEDIYYTYLHTFINFDRVDRIKLDGYGECQLQYPGGMVRPGVWVDTQNWTGSIRIIVSMMDGNGHSGGAGRITCECSASTPKIANSLPPVISVLSH